MTPTSYKLKIKQGRLFIQEKRLRPVGTQNMSYVYKYRDKRLCLFFARKTRVGASKLITNFFKKIDCVTCTITRQQLCYM